VCYNNLHHSVVFNLFILKILFTLFVLLFSSFVVAENLPISLLGIKLFQINPFSEEEATLSHDTG